VNGGDPSERPLASAEPEQLDEDDLALIAAAGLSTADVTAIQRKVLARMSPRSKQRLRWMVDNWPGRVVFRLVAGLRQLQIFDRAMTIAAQTFTSVFPIIIMWVSIFGGPNAAQALGGAGLPADAENVLNDVVHSSGFGAFGVVGVLVVLISATSLSRALTRSYDTIWRHGRTKIPPKGTWRWLAAVLVLAGSLVLNHRLVSAADDLQPPYFWTSVAIVAVSTFIACFIPWILMAARVPVRLLLPGAVLFGVVILLAHPVAQRYLSTAMQTSAERFGPIGVAFTYLTYLYCVSWALLGTAVLGRVIVIDPGLVGRLIRGNTPIEEEQTSVEEDA
jgi:membrane protein